MATYRRTAQADPDFESVFFNNMVLVHKVGAMIRLTWDDFVRLSRAFFAEIESKYAE